MKSNKFQERFYRDWVKSKDLVTSHVIAKESDLFISTDKPVKIDYIKGKIRFYRKQIEDYIKDNRDFLTSLKPIECSKDAPGIIKDMIAASKKANVGPMAAIAGAVAEYLGNDLLKTCKEVIVENGGDIFMKINSPRRIGIYAGSSELSNKIFLDIKPEEKSFGLCTSSGTVGHSLSFGKTDATVIIAESAILADALATSIGNLVKKADDLKCAIDFARSIKGLRGVLIIIGSALSAWGDINISK